MGVALIAEVQKLLMQADNSKEKQVTTKEDTNKSTK